MDSPDAPITSSIATLQSGDSYSFRRQVRPTESTIAKSAQSTSSLTSHKNTTQKTDRLASPLITFSRNASPALKSIENNAKDDIDDENDDYLLMSKNYYHIDHQNSVTRTPDTPSAIITPSESSSQSQRESQSSLLLPRINSDNTPTSPSAILTPSSDFSGDHHINLEDYQEFPNFIGFEDDPWDLAGFERKFDIEYTYDSNMGSSISFLPEKPTPPDSLEL